MITKQKMKKMLAILHVLIIALWPVVFLLIIGPIEHSLRSLAGQTYQPVYSYLAAIIYAASGGLFAVSGYYGKGSPGNRGIVSAHIVAGAFVVLFFAIWLVNHLSGVMFNIAGNIFVSLNWNTMALVLGYTLCTAARAIALFRKKAIV